MRERERERERCGERVRQMGAVAAEEASLGTRLLVWKQKRYQSIFPGSLGRNISFPKPEMVVVGETMNIY